MRIILIETKSYKIYSYRIAKTLPIFFKKTLVRFTASGKSKLIHNIKITQQLQKYLQFTDLTIKNNI